MGQTCKLFVIKTNYVLIFAVVIRYSSLHLGSSSAPGLGMMSRSWILVTNETASQLPASARQPVMPDECLFITEHSSHSER